MLEINAAAIVGRLMRGQLLPASLSPLEVADVSLAYLEKLSARNGGSWQRPADGREAMRAIGEGRESDGWLAAWIVRSID